MIKFIITDATPDESRALATMFTQLGGERDTPPTYSEDPEPVSENPEPVSENPEPISENPEPVLKQRKDSQGILWDKRIHSEKKTLTDDGKWRAKRNLDPKYAELVMRELIPSVVPFDTFFKRMSADLAARRITIPTVNQIIKEFGIETIPMVAMFPQHIAAIMKKLDEVING